MSGCGCAAVMPRNVAKGMADDVAMDVFIMR
jgi:hypothetical protein